MLKPIGALTALFLLVGIGTPAKADFVSGTVIVAKSYPGAMDNPNCYVPLISTSNPALLKGPPCKTIQYACNLIMTNPGGYGPGPVTPLGANGQLPPQSSIPPTGAGGWRLLFGTPTAAHYPDIYVENVVCPASGVYDASGTLYPFRIIAHSGPTRIHGVPGSTAPALQLNGDNMFFGKLDFFGIPTAQGEALHVGELSPSTKRHTNVTVYYDTLYQNTYSIAIHVYNLDGFVANNSAIIEAGQDGSPCMKIENSTKVHIDTNAVQRCGTQFGTPAIATNGVEIWNSPGFSVSLMNRSNPAYTKNDLYVGSSSPNSSILNNDHGTDPLYKCLIPAADLAGDTISGNTCTTY